MILSKTVSSLHVHAFLEDFFSVVCYSTILPYIQVKGPDEEGAFDFFGSIFVRQMHGAVLMFSSPTVYFPYDFPFVNENSLC